MCTTMHCPIGWHWQVGRPKFPSLVLVQPMVQLAGAVDAICAGRGRVQLPASALLWSRGTRRRDQCPDHPCLATLRSTRRYGGVQRTIGGYEYEASQYSLSGFRRRDLGGVISHNVPPFYRAPLAYTFFFNGDNPSLKEITRTTFCFEYSVDIIRIWYC